MAPAFAMAPAAPAPGEAWVTTLDVGQGLAVLVRTSNRALLYDAGPAFGTETDSGARIIVPALRGAGLSRLDAMVLTHEDADHIGGALTVLEALEVDALASSLPARHGFNALAGSARPCRRGMEWEWDGVRFEMLHPAPDAAPRRRNDLSCVLRVASTGGAMLLTGDIERAAELQLVAANNVKSDVLLVPHHGSRTSSGAELIAAVAPRWAVVPAGYRNRFGHPNGEVLERYRSAGAMIARTDLDGAVSVRLGTADIALETERRRRERYWLK
jgi:competence protein ComEC